MIRRRHSAITAKKKITNYFRMTALEDETTFTLLIGSSVSTSILSYIEYSINEGETWTRLVNANSTTKTATITVNTNESVVLRGKGTSMSSGSSTGVANFTWFKGNKQYKVSGVIMTLLKGKWADKYTSIGTTSYTFKLLFTDETNLTDAGDLILPPDITTYCYYFMFYKCTSLTRAPELKALTLKNNCYLDMFFNCSKLTYIKMLATNVSASNCLYAWLPATLANLEFHRNPEATWWVVGANGIPLQSILFDDTEPLQERISFIDPEVHRIVLANWGNKKPAGAASSFKNSVKIGGVDGKILKRLILGVLLIATQFTENTTIVDFSDFNKFENLLYIGDSNRTRLYSLSYHVGFYNCTSLKYITLPSKLLTLACAYTYGKGCFMNTKIESIYIPDTVDAASDYLFAGCSQLKSVRWGSKLPVKVNNTSYWGGVFKDCSNLESLTNYPTYIPTVSSLHFANCSKLDFTNGLIDFESITWLGGEGLRRCLKLPDVIVFSSLTTLGGNYTFANLTNTRALYFPKLTDISGYKFAYCKATILDLGPSITSLSTSGGTSYWPNNFVQKLVLRTKTTLSLAGLFASKVTKYYVYEDIYDTVISNYSSIASKIFKIGGEDWFTDFGSYYEYADYPASDPIFYNENLGGSISINYPMYNPDITLNLQFRGRDYRSIVLPFADVHWEYTRMGGDEFREITGVTATVDGEGNLTGFTVQSLTVTGNITPNKPYLVTTGMNGDGISGEYYTEILHSNNVVQSTNAITDEFTSNGYKFSFTGTYNFIDNMEGKYAFDGTNWNLCSSNDTMKATYVYMEVTKIEE